MTTSQLQYRFRIKHELTLSFLPEIIEIEIIEISDILFPLVEIRQ